MDSNDLYIYESVLTYAIFQNKIAAIFNFHVDEPPSWIVLPFKYFIFLDQCKVFVTKDASSSLEENIIYIRLNLSVYQLLNFCGLPNMVFCVWPINLRVNREAMTLLHQ